MSYCNDLIDLSSDGNFCTALQPSKPEGTILVPRDAAVFSNAGQEQRFSFDNPFDCALRKTALENDPFEIVAQQIEDQRLAGVPRCVEVQIGNLLDLDDQISADDPPDLSIRQLHEDSDGSGKVSPIEHLSRSGTTASYVEERRKASSVVSTTPKTNVSDRNIKVSRLSNGDIRTQLLKSSVSSSPLGPLLRRSSKSSEDGSEKSSNYDSMHVNVSEFNDSCDDIYAIKPNWVDSETEQDSDLEQLNIPMLQQIDDDSEKKATERDRLKNNANSKKTTAENDKPSNGSQNKIDLEMIRDRVKRHKSGKSSPQDVDELIISMKHVVSECSDESQRFEAIQLLENLSTLLCKKSPESKEDKSKVECLLDVPQPMVRQGTFDLDKSKSPNNFMVNENEPLDSADSGVHESQESLPCSENPELPSILEQIGLLLGNQNINVLQTNLSSTENSGQNPTYIVVMGTPNTHVPVTPIRQHTQILMNNPTSPEFEHMPRNRSQSLSLHDNKSAKRKSIVTPSSPSVFTTPTRPQTLKRRSTISFSPGHSSASQKIPQKPETSKQSNLQRRQSLNSDRNAFLPKIAAKNISNMGVEPNAKSLKVKTSECTRRAVGPIKATVPVKKVLPMVTTPSNLSSSRGALDSKLLTSTPIAVTSTSNSSIKSPPRRSIVGKNKFHSPSLSATPNMKASTKSSLSGLQRRRSLTDSKSAMLTTNSTSSKTSANPSQFLRRSTFGISYKTTTPAQPRNKENACPK